jgi:PAS domain-containing protein
MRRNWYWFAVRSPWLLLLLLVAPPGAEAATVLEKRVVHTVQGDGSVLQETTLRIRLEKEADREEWSTYPVWLDDHRDLENIVTYATDPQGKRVKVKARHHDEVSVSGAGELYGSARARLVDFPHLAPGSELVIQYRVRETPYFPVGSIFLAEGDPIAALTVELRGLSSATGGGGDWRWHLSGSAEGFDLQEVPGGLTLTARDLADREDLGKLDPEGRAPKLYYGWGAARSWRDVGLWYEDILAPVGRGEATVRAQARSLVSGVEDPRQRLETLLAFLRQDVRYVAVEVGIGGFRPTPAAETLERRWGDCKDKSLLLIDLLHEVGVEAYPVLIRSSLGSDIDAAFPSPGQFNHLIVAVPEGAVATDENDPVADAYLFLDPTQERGGAGWLAPWVQGKQALVVRGEKSALVTTPQRTAQESRHFAIRARVDLNGNARGRAVLTFTGRRAAAFRDVLQTPDAEPVLRATFQRLLPGSNLGGVQWDFEEASVPRLETSAEVYLAALVQDSGDRRSVKLPGLTGTPAPRELDEPDFPLLVEPVSDQVQWRLEIPAPWCLPEAAHQETRNALGHFQQAITREGDALVVERQVEIGARKIGAEELEPLKELSLAEHRAQQRRLRWECSP